MISRRRRSGKGQGMTSRRTLPQKSAEVNGETRDELAKMAGVSHDTIAKVEKIVAEAEPDVVEATAGLMSAVREAAALAARRKRRVVARSWPRWRRRRTRPPDALRSFGSCSA